VETTRNRDTDTTMERYQEVYMAYHITLLITLSDLQWYVSKCKPYDINTCLAYISGGAITEQGIISYPNQKTIWDDRQSCQLNYF